MKRIIHNYSQFLTFLHLGGVTMTFFKKKTLYKLICCVLTISFFCTDMNVSAASVSAGSVSQSSDNSSGFEWPVGPSVYSDAAIVMEASTGLVLYEKDIYDSHYPASITKIMTTLLALENCNLNETVTMSHEAEWDVDFNSSRIGLVEGEQLSLEDALYGVMLESANEVSYAVGEHVANGPISDFSAMMNERAKELGSVNTNFVNPNGLHDDNHYTCAYDMALISRAAIQIPEFRKITGSRTHTIPPTNKNVARPLANHHRFIRKTLNYDGAIGGKTGGTNEAKTTLVTYAERNGLTLIAVVLHVDTALHAYEDTAKILDFAFDNYSLYSIEQTELTGDESFPDLFASLSFFGKGGDTLLRLSENSNIVLPISANFADAKKTISLSPVEEFTHGDNVIGQISYTYEGKYVGSSDIIYYNKDYPLTKAEFELRWPSYLLPPDYVLTGSSASIPTTEENVSVGTDDTNLNDSTPTLNSDTEEENKSSSVNIKPILLGITAAAIIIVLGWYVLFVELPHRRRRKAYRANHKRRMENIHSFMKDDLL